MFGGAEGTGRRGSGARPGGSGSTSVPKLQKEMKEMKVKHKEEMYWLKLELDTMKREKEAVETRMSELFRDMQEMKDPTIATADSDDSEAQLQAKVKKYSAMVKALNNQIILVRHSSEQIVKNLKDEIKDVVDTSSQTEKELINELEKVQKENESLKAKLQGGSGASPSNELKAECETLKKDKAELQAELKNERAKSRDTIGHLRQEKTRLSEMLERMQGDVLVLRSSAEAVQSMDQIREDRDESIATLERVATLWDRADEAIQSLETVMEELKPKEEQPVDNEDRERALSTLESASLVHGQVKVSLMLIELKLRNGVMSLKNDAAELGSMALAEPAIIQQISQAQEESLAAIAKLEDSLKLQMDHLEDKSIKETKEVKENLENRVKDLKEMQAKQKKLEQEVAQMSVEELGTLAKQTSGSPDKNVELFVSRKILERLQNEVLQVVARVKEKNETIGRLEAAVEERKAREKTLLEELRKLMKDRGDEFEEEELLEEILEDEESVVDEEIIEEEEDFIEEEVLETSSLS
mmetsp:Transcript_565/g.1068  ORF Transcript_565/g.1068 Transcript_565/m.1068 type:complete len:528 (-) Transcript_565:119-1702(-)